jgi:hypothetical protein
MASFAQAKAAYEAAQNVNKVVGGRLAAADLEAARKTLSAAAKQRRR